MYDTNNITEHTYGRLNNRRTCLSLRTLTYLRVIMTANYRQRRPRSIANAHWLGSKPALK